MFRSCGCNRCCEDTCTDSCGCGGCGGGGICGIINSVQNLLTGEYCWLILILILLYTCCN